MPQGPIPTNVANNPSNARAPMKVDAQGALVANAEGLTPVYNVTAATVIKATPGRVARVIVQTVATAGTFSVNDCATTGAAAISNQIVGYTAAWPAAGTVIYLNWPCATGIVVNPGTSGVVSVDYA